MQSLQETLKTAATRAKVKQEIAEKARLACPTYKRAGILNSKCGHCKVSKSLHLVQAAFDVLHSEQIADPARAAWACGEFAPKLFHDNNAAVIGEQGGIPAVLDAVRKHPEDVDVAWHALRALTYLVGTSQELNRQRILDLGGVAVVAALMRSHPGDLRIARAGCVVFWYLPCNADQQAQAYDEMRQNGAISALVSAFRMHVDDADLAKEACGTIHHAAFSGK